ncbi:alpha/beta hydrolase [Luteolibacter marinus]|uniref:alpha/beta hydrolase n=1 Tax=Luteolibacter marinus TaxID=2776705 RepID=UPI001D0184BA|nr:alpha/beta hydrolase [Luteolibacter marinus]
MKALCTFATTTLLTIVAAAAAPEKIPLWQGPAPLASGNSENVEVFMTLYRPEAPNGAAMVICPGGGYGGLVTGGEGSGIASWLNKHHITGFVLEYRLPHGRPDVPLRDAQRAIRLARSKAREWGCDPGRIGIIGFSAGGHLAATAATRFDDGDPDAEDPVDRTGCRPDFAVLVYPVITMGEGTHGGSRNNLLGENPAPELVTLYSAEKQVTAKTPPVFLTHAEDDQVVPCRHCKLLHEALLAHKVPAEYLELPSGGHGLNGYKGPMWDAWQAAALDWLAARKVIPASDASQAR